MKPNILNIIIISAAAAFMVIVGFNCAPSHSSGGSSRQQSFGGTEGTSPDSPYVLLNAEQTLDSMINVSGVTPANNILTEYRARKTSLAVNSDLTLANAPLLLSSTSLAGEICSALIAKERPLALDARRFLKMTNLAAGPASTSLSEFSTTAERFAIAFWGRAPSSTERDLLADYYTTFRSSLPAAMATQANQTANLYLSTCSAMLSSFDFLTF